MQSCNPGVGTWNTKNLARELHPRVFVINARGALEHLHNRALAVNLQDLPSANRAVAELDVDDLGVLRGLLGNADEK